jgi:hypothetical protein
LGQWKNEAIRLNALSGYTKNLYVPGALCTVREAAYLFGSEFGGEDMLKFFDDRSGWKSAGLGSLRRVLTVAATSPSAYRRSAEGIPLNRRGSLTERPVAPPVNPMLSLR